MNVLNTQSFRLTLNDQLAVEKIECTSPELEEICGTDHSKMTMMLVQELAINLFASKDIVEIEVGKNTEHKTKIGQLEEEVETLEDKVHKLTVDNEGLRDMLDDQK